MRGVAALFLCVVPVAAFHVSTGASTIAPRSTPAIRSPARMLPSSVAMSSVIAKEDYKLGASLAVTGIVILAAPWLPGGFFLLLGAFLLFQTLRIRFVFDEDAFEVQTKPLDDLFSNDLTNTGENFAVGGENRWSYSSFVNYDFFPGERLPILVYFKETQTPQDKWDVGPGQWANGPDALAKGAVKGQVHFFPCIASAEELKSQFEARGCAKL